MFRHSLWNTFGTPREPTSVLGFLEHVLLLLHYSKDTHVEVCYLNSAGNENKHLDFSPQFVFRKKSVFLLLIIFIVLPNHFENIVLRLAVWS